MSDFDEEAVEGSTCEAKERGCGQECIHPAPDSVKRAKATATIIDGVARLGASVAG